MTAILVLVACGAAGFVGYLIGLRRGFYAGLRVAGYSGIEIKEEEPK